jgi:uncharacterized protein with ATP-grasp and redox domains
MKAWEREEESHFSVMADFVGLADIGSDRKRALAEELARYMRVRLAKGNWLPSEITQLHSDWYREFYKILGVADPYLQLKKQLAVRAAEILAEVAPCSFREAAVASIYGNRMDLGTGQAIAADGSLSLDLGDFQELGGEDLFIDDLEELQSQIASARSILLLVDNCGEILFDRVLVDWMRRINSHGLITAAAKSAPMINDATFDDLKSAGFHDSLRLISTGTNSFGVPLAEASPEFLDAYQEADLVIAKGQAHLEFWVGFSEQKLFHLACTKFPVRANRIGLIPAGVSIALSSRRYAEDKSTYLPSPGVHSRE